MAKARDEYIIKFGVEGETELAKMRVELSQVNEKLKQHTNLTKKQNGASGSAIQRNKKLNKEKQRLTRNIERQTNALKKQTVATKKSSEGLGMMALKAAASVQAFRMLSQFLISSVKDFAAYEKGVRNVTTLLTAEQTNMFSTELYEGVLDASKKFGFEIQDINKALFDAVSAGISGAEALEFLETSSKLAMAGVTSLKSATLGLTTVLNAYNMETSEAQKVSEILFTTQKFGVTTVEELSKSLGVVVPFAAASGISLEELGAAIATTTRSGLDAAKTVTALRAAISQMQKPAADSRDLFLQYGIPIGAAEMKAVGFTETLRRLNKVYKESPEVIEQMFGNVRGLTAIFSLAGENADQYNEILAETSDEQKRAANLLKGTEDLMESTDTKINRMTASYKDFKIALGDSTFFKELIDELTKSFDILGSEYLSFWEKINPLLSQDATHRMHETRKEADAAMTALEEMREVVESGEVVNIEGMLGTPEGIPKEDEDRVKQVIEIAKRAQKEIDDFEKSFGASMGVDYSNLIADYEEYLAGIKAAQDAADAEEDAADKRKTRLKREYDELERELRVQQVKDIEKLTLDGIASGEYQNVTELAIAELKYKNLAKLKENYEKNSGAASQAEMLRVEGEMSKLRIDIEKKTLAIQKSNRKSYNDEQADKEKAFYDARTAAAKEQAETRALTNREFRIQEIEREIAYYKSLMEIDGAGTDEMEKNRRKLAALEVQLAKASFTETKKDNKTKVDLAKKSIDAISDMMTQAAETEFENQERLMQRRMELAQQEADNGLINQRQLADEKERLEKESFEQRKEHELKLAKINLLQELSNIAVQAAGNPSNKFTFGASGLAQYAVLAAIALGRYASNVSAIQSQKFAQGGLVFGNSHAQGGEKFAVGGRVVELEGGEAVINKRSTAMFGNTLSAMNQAGGGRAFSSPNFGGSNLIDYEALGNAISRNTNVVLPVESLNKTQNRVRMIEQSAKF